MKLKIFRKGLKICFISWGLLVLGVFFVALVSFCFFYFLPVRLRASKIPDLLSCSLELKKSAAFSLTIVHEKVSLTCSLRVV